jgi:Zn-dependent protease with chaperone function/Tfp pilus assembly protein PilF
MWQKVCSHSGEMNVDQTAFSGEKPLSKGSIFALGCAAAGTMLLFYVFSAVSVLLLVVLLAFETVFLLVALRFGLAGPMARVMNRHLAALPILFRSFWIRKGSEFRVALHPDDAPRLFRLLGDLCERANVAVPREVLLEMTVNAWVRMDGYRRGAGKTTLGIGYDLLAGLSEREMAAVLAHEVTHARLVQRGFSKWLKGGLARAVRLAAGLAALVDAGRRMRQPSDLARMLFKPADWLARTCARLVAACSRQDEFAADHGAAELCGADALRSALVKLEKIGRAAARLPWRERVAQLQLGEGFARWLVTELSSGSNVPTPEDKTEPFDKYATHPSLSDRLAALPASGNNYAEISPPAMELLAQPDRIAEQLIAEIQRVVALEEQKDTKALDRWSRKVRSQSYRSPVQSFGLLLALIGGVVGVLVWLTVSMSVGLLVFMAATIIPGILAYRFGGYRERAPLPVPDFSLLKTAFQAKAAVDETKAKQAESELQPCIADQKRGRRKARLLVDEAYRALAQCDYLKAHVAARLALKFDKKSVEAMSAFGVASAGLGQAQQVTWALQALQKRTPITRGSTAWATGWTLLLVGNWTQAEAFLQIARKGREEEPTLLALQALCQARRGKHQSAILSARQACTPKPRNPEYAKLLVNLLLDGGFLREAQEQLGKLETAGTTDSELILCLVRLNLMIHKDTAAAEWTQQLKQNAPGARSLLQLGGVYESCRKAEQAAGFYFEALASGHYPEALLGLGRLAVHQQNNEAARRHLLAALDVERPAAEGSCGSLPILQATLQQLLVLQEPKANCIAWIATLNASGTPQAFANKSLMVYAPSQQEAQQSLTALLSAMQRGRPPAASPGSIAWRRAPQEQQPFGTVRPGVQGVLG